MAAPASQSAQKAAEKAVTETANTTAQEAANQSPGLMSSLPVDPMVLVIGIVSAVAVAILAGIAILVWSSRNSEEEEFEKESLESIVKPEFRNIVRDQGKVNKSTVRRDLRREGEVWKDIRFNENDNLKDHIKTLRQNDDTDFNLSLNLSTPDKEQLEKLKNSGVYDKGEIDQIDDQGVVPHRLMWIRPHKTLDKLMWLITDKIGGKDIYSSYRLIPEHRIVDNPGDNSISIDRKIQLRPFAGVELPLFFESFSILHAVVTRRLYEASLEDQVNYSEKVNFFDSKFSQRIQEIKAEAEAESERYKSDVAGDVNNA